MLRCTCCANTLSAGGRQGNAPDPRRSPKKAGPARLHTSHLSHSQLSRETPPILRLGHGTSFRLPPSAPDPRHGGTASVAFTDSHVEQQSLEDLGYGVNDDGSVAIDGTGVTNRRFSGRGGDLDPPSIH